MNAKPCGCPDDEPCDGTQPDCEPPNANGCDLRYDLSDHYPNGYVIRCDTHDRARCPSLNDGPPCPSCGRRDVDTIDPPPDDPSGVRVLLHHATEPGVAHNRRNDCPGGGQEVPGVPA